MTKGNGMTTRRKQVVGTWGKGVKHGPLPQTVATWNWQPFGTVEVDSLAK